MEQVTQTVGDVVGTIGDGFSIVKNITAIIASITTNPIMTLVATGVVVATLLGLWVWFKAWLKKKEIDAAKRETEQNEQEQHDTRIPQNEADGKTDNEGRSKLDDLK